jgi:hypothetical protein
MRYHHSIFGIAGAIRGDVVVKIRFAMGHSDLATTQRYINDPHTTSSDSPGPRSEGGRLAP